MEKKENTKRKFPQKNIDIPTIKILTLGSSTVGKTSFIMKFTENAYIENTLLTTGIDIQTKIIQTEEGKKIRANFYDTAGQEKYKSISFNLVKNADGIILMYDITKKNTYKDISYWMEGIEENKKKEFPILLLGNKCDLEEKRKVSVEEGKELANEYKIDFMESSNKSGFNIKEAGNLIIKKIIEIKEKEEEKEKKELKEKNLKNQNEKIKITKETHTKKKKWSFSKICPFF